jgi:toluene monooxygenase system protein B
MAPFPVQGITEGDFVVVLALVDDEQPMSEVAQAIAYHGAGKRVALQDRPLRVRYHGDLLPDDATIASAGITPLEVLEAVYA